MKNRSLAAGMWICMFLVPAFEAAPGFAQGPIWAPPGLSGIIAEGIADNQSISSMRQEIAAMADQVPAAGALPDPMLGVGLLNLPTNGFSFDQEPMTQKQIALEQQIPWPGKLNLKSRMAAQEVGSKKALLDARILSLARNIADAYYELGYVEESLRNNARLTGLVGQIKREAQDRYAVGRGLQQDIFQAEMELSRLSEERVMLENRRRTIQDKLNTMLNRSPYQPVSPPSEPEIKIPDFSLPKVKEAALQYNPDLVAKRFEISRAETAVALAKKDYLPNMNFKLAYGQRDRDMTGRELPDFVSASVMVSLPVWYRTKQDKNLASALKRLQAAKSAYAQLKDTLPHRLDALAVELADTQQRLAVYNNELIPQARQWARSANDAYEVGKSEFDTMIRARMQVLDHELAAAKLRFGQYQKLAALEELVGRPVADLKAAAEIQAPKDNDHE